MEMGPMGSQGRDIVVDPSRCDGCGDCIESCREAVSSQHKKTDALSRIWIHDINDKRYPMVCHNCEQAPCVSACMTGCRHRMGEFVTTDYERCVGCSMCIMCCPFGAIQLVQEERLAMKCDGCLSYETAPCVKACKTGALRQVGFVEASFENRKLRASSLALARLYKAGGDG